MKGIDIDAPHGRLIAGGLALFVTCLIGACGYAPPSSTSDNSDASTPEPASAQHSEAAGVVVSAAEELARYGVSVTQFTPTQEAALYVTMGVEGMDVTSDGYEIPQSVKDKSVAGMEFRIPSDPKARWGLIDVTQRNFPVSYIFTHRVGPSGTTYSMREYDCDSNMVRYLATGQNIDEMRTSKQDDRMSEIHPRSIAYYLGKLACTDLAR
ncbi:hypothetical protein N5J29_12660 [Stenotrophomonas sp. GD03680]|uniref:hypothetical protein n=1 Tax=Stenotrophomonas sp. GD03680 TaxID=2975365 RepID=UPI00244A827F|nr:hypothetical protein [Stenotrophomonas sp. GD03680]MDH2023607.1 hypothetical protein [Stenotrophomonas sp. GD03680]